MTQRAGRAEEETGTDNAADGDCDEGEQRESQSPLCGLGRGAWASRSTGQEEVDGRGRGRRTHLDMTALETVCGTSRRESE